MPEQDCCCEEASVKEEEGCLPTGITGLSAEPVVLRGNYSYTVQTERGREYRRGVITFSSLSPETKEDVLPSTLSSQGFTWNKGTQWQRACDEEMKVPKVVYHPTYKNGWETDDRVPEQEHDTKCLVFSFIRHCPAGEGLYVKQPNEGECFQEPGLAGEKSRELTRSAGLSFKCPEGYHSGTELATDYSPRCKCRTKCA
ncbi:unnamed protein product [Symbiodinium natans]|uniref:Uncharacterized protein n=1 Tax=Symbiodinium natans TaxID=878477 RepID=A0A812RZ86_9DINO|nr:unnamed protein product [Symbiodinium natans]